MAPGVGFWFSVRFWIGSSVIENIPKKKKLGIEHFGLQFGFDSKRTNWILLEEVKTKKYMQVLK